MTKDDALRLAQRALSNKNAPARVVYEALAAIRKVLQQGETMIADQACAERGCACRDYRDGPGVEMVRREWQGLTDEELEVLNDCGDTDSYQFAKAIEAKLKEKNT